MRRYFSIKTVHALLWALFLLSAGLFGWNLLYGPATLSVFEVRILEIDVSFALRIDSLSTLLFAMITLLGAAIGRFAIRFLDGESRQWYFFQNLLQTILSVSLFVLSSNLLMLFAMWLATSYGVHRLLLYYPERPGARFAARKKIIISRIGDVAVLTGIVSIYRVFGTLEFADIFARTGEVAPGSPQAGLLALGGVAFALGAMAKSAQFPLHFWLPETMETPTPVSALMHAGIINGGGFLMIRLSPLLQSAEWANVLLTMVGAITAVFGALAMIAQNDIKKKLAFSTISQMGMMIFACGLGAYTIALFHIFAHSFYKAHAFLSTGTLVEEGRKVAFHIKPLPFAGLLLLSLAAVALPVAGIVWRGGEFFALAAYCGVLLLGLVQNIGQRSDGPFSVWRVFPWVVTGMLLALVAYAGIEYGMGHYLEGLVPRPHSGHALASPWVGGVLLSFAVFLVGFWLSAVLMRPRSELARRLYVYFWNGGYLSNASTRWIHDIAPVRAERALGSES